MNIHEYQAKELFRIFGIPVPAGLIVLNPSEIPSKCKEMVSGKIVVKAQIHAGGRGKAGGVKVVENSDEASSAAQSMFGTNLVTHQTGPSGQTVRRVYLESASAIKKEYYLSAIMNRQKGVITFIASADGGMEIEEVAKRAPDRIKRVDIDPAFGFSACHARKLGYGMGLSKAATSKLADIIGKIFDLFIAKDASQVEINPLIEDVNGEFIALDAKINFDDNALYRHSDIEALRDEDEENSIEIEASRHGLNYIQMDGDIGCMVNGAGLAMATMDIIKCHGGNPANFLDVGGGANLETVTAAFKIILSDPKVRSILVNIFGGIMRCDIIAEGVVQAVRDIGIKVPLVVRLSGTNFQKGNEILKESGLELITASTLDDAAQKIVKVKR